MNKLTVIFSFITCLAFWTCDPGPVGGAIEDTYWNLTSIKEGSKKTDLQQDTGISAIFSRDKISGISTCNRYSGRFTAEGKKLTVSDLIATEKMCDNMSLEQTYLGLLGKTSGYSVVKEGLVIYTEDGRLTFEPMSEKEKEDIIYAEGVGKLVGLFPPLQAESTPHFYPIVRVDRPGNYPYTGQLVNPEMYPYFDNETSDIWNSTGGDVMAVCKYQDFYICRVPGRYVSSDIALFQLENGVLRRSETIAWAWCDEGWCNQQDAWLQDINKDGRLDIAQHYTLTDDRGKIREERMTILLQGENGTFKSSTDFQLDKSNFKMADI